MRRLHLVRPEERFIASGTYASVHHALPAEAWTLHQVAEGWFVRVDRSEADRFILCEALLEASGQPARFNEEHFNATGRVEKLHHVFAEGVRQSTHTRRAEETTYAETTYAADMLPVLWPLVLVGLACWALLQHPLWYGSLTDTPQTRLRPDVIGSETRQTYRSAIDVQQIRFGTQHLWLDSRGIAHKIEDHHNEFTLRHSTAR